MTSSKYLKKPTTKEKDQKKNVLRQYSSDLTVMKTIWK